MDLEFDATVTTISKGTNSGIAVTLVLSSGTGIMVQVPKGDEKAFTIGDTYTFTGVKSK